MDDIDPVALALLIARAFVEHERDQRGAEDENYDLPAEGVLTIINRAIDAMPSAKFQEAVEKVRLAGLETLVDETFTEMIGLKPGAERQ